VCLQRVAHRLAGRAVPAVDAAIAGARGQDAAVRAEGQAVGARAADRQGRVDRAARGRVPAYDRPVAAARREQAAIRADRHAAHFVGVAAQKRADEIRSLEPG